MLLKTEQYSRFAVALGEKFPTREACLASNCNALIPATSDGKYYATCMPSTNDSTYMCRYDASATAPGSTPTTIPAVPVPVTPAPVTTTDANVCQRGNMLLLNIKGRSKDRARDGLLMDYFDKTLYIPYGHLMKPRVSISFDNN
jgi:hypothetical protein